MAVTSVEEIKVKLRAGAEPKLTALAPMKLVPLMVTEVSPASRPATGVTVLTTGATS
jgi:hypothetical protein